MYKNKYIRNYFGGTKFIPRANSKIFVENRLSNCKN